MIPMYFHPRQPRPASPCRFMLGWPNIPDPAPTPIPPRCPTPQYFSLSTQVVHSGRGLSEQMRSSVESQLLHMRRQEQLYLRAVSSEEDDDDNDSAAASASVTGRVRDGPGLSSPPGTDTGTGSGGTSQQESSAGQSHALQSEVDKGALQWHNHHATPVIAVTDKSTSSMITTVPARNQHDMDSSFTIDVVASLFSVFGAVWGSGWGSAWASGWWLQRQQSPQAVNPEHDSLEHCTPARGSANDRKREHVNQRADQHEHKRDQLITTDDNTDDDLGIYCAREWSAATTDSDGDGDGDGTSAAFHHRVRQVLTLLLPVHTLLRLFLLLAASSSCSCWWWRCLCEELHVCGSLSEAAAPTAGPDDAWRSSCSTGFAHLNAGYASECSQQATNSIYWATQPRQGHQQQQGQFQEAWVFAIDLLCFCGILWLLNQQRVLKYMTVTVGRARDRDWLTLLVCAYVLVTSSQLLTNGCNLARQHFLVPRSRSAISATRTGGWKSDSVSGWTSGWTRGRYSHEDWNHPHGGGFASVRTKRGKDANAAHVIRAVRNDGDSSHDTTVAAAIAENARAAKVSHLVARGGLFTSALQQGLRVSAVFHAATLWLLANAGAPFDAESLSGAELLSLVVCSFVMSAAVLEPRIDWRQMMIGAVKETVAAGEGERGGGLLGELAGAWTGGGEALAASIAVALAAHHPVLLGVQEWYLWATWILWLITPLLAALPLLHTLHRFILSRLEVKFVVVVVFKYAPRINSLE